MELRFWTVTIYVCVCWIYRTCTNSGMVSMSATLALLTGSLAMMCRAPVQPSTISSILTPS